MSRPQVVLATNNPGKVEELRRILGGDVELLGLQDVTAYEPGPETGATFEQNALAKAVEAVQHTGHAVHGVDRESAVVGDGRQPGVVHRLDGLGQRVLLERRAGLGTRLVRRHVVEAEQLDLAAEDAAQLLDLARVVGRQDDLGTAHILAASPACFLRSG